MKKTKFVPRVLFGDRCFNDLDRFIAELFMNKKQYSLYIIDSVHQETGLRERLKYTSEDLIIEFNASMNEPKTSDVDIICKKIAELKGNEIPQVVVGIGGGSTLDVAKAVSIMLTNPGSSADYQGYDLVNNLPVPKIAVPTLSGTGAESTRTAVLTSPKRKFGINSKYSMYNAIILDPELLETVPADQEFFSGMDNFIHSVEALNGSAMNAMGKPYAIQAKTATEDFFLKEKKYDEFMVGSFLGGCSIANSSVGICHALSYGIGFILGYRHGIANSIVFSHLHEFYGEDVIKFHQMVEKNNIEIPSDVTSNVTPEQLEKMITVTYTLEKDLISALGPDYRKILTPEKIIKLYEKM